MLTIIISALYYLIWVINMLIFVRVLISWFPAAYHSKVGSILVWLTEPVLAPIRKLLMNFEFSRSLPVDFSPIVAWLLLIVIQRIIQIVAVLLGA